MIDAALAEREKVADMLARAIWTAEASWKAQREFAWARHIADAILANPKLLAVCANEARLEEAERMYANWNVDESIRRFDVWARNHIAELRRALKAEG